jgi:hypothetical protein
MSLPIPFALPVQDKAAWHENRSYCVIKRPFVFSGGNDPTTGQPVPGVARISDQIQQLATFDIKAYTAQ